MDRTLRALAALLAYPDPVLAGSMGEIRAHLMGSIDLRAGPRRALEELLDFLGSRDLLEAQEHYVAQFDIGRATSLNLFEHVHGESRDRGQAMVDLREKYREAGLEPSTRELPDFLPMVLEFLAVRPRREAVATLADCAPILRSIGERLRDRASPYSAVFAALLDLAGEPPFAAASPPQPEPASLDDEWAEAPAFGTAVASPEARPAVVRFVPRH